MQDAPDISELLRVARSALLERVLPELPPHLTRDVRMVASAMAIVQRGLRLQDAAHDAEQQRLVELYGSRGRLPIQVINRLLASEARAWKFGSDPERERKLASHLRQCTVEKLRENNPKALESLEPK